MGEKSFARAAARAMLNLRLMQKVYAENGKRKPASR
jgi:hypothetical protein